MAKKIILFGNKGVVIVDDDDYAVVSQYKWHIQSMGYAEAWIEGRNITMHRFLLSAKKGQEVDHKNGNKLDNQRSNIRLCSSQENNANKSISKINTTGYKGVYVAKSGKFYSQIKVNRIGKHLGFFDDAVSAAIAYDNAAKIWFGSFAKTNF